MRPDELSLEEQLVASIAIANHRKSQNQENNEVEKVSFETNVPVTVALKYADGKRVESRYNEYEVFYSLVDGRALYASPILAEKIAGCAPRAGEAFTIVKREVKDGQRKRIEWYVALGAPQAAAAPQTQERPAIQAPAAPAAVNAQTPQRHSSTPQGPVTTQDSAQPLAQAMGGALIAAIDALAIAREYGRTKGFALDFNEEDVRTTAASIFITASRERENRTRQYYSDTRAAAAEGNAAWRQ